MNLKDAKKETDVTLDGVSIELEKQNGSIMAVTLRDKAGHVLVVRQGPYSSLGVFVPAPPTMVKRWKIEGVCKGLRFSELFENKYDADKRLIDLSEDGEPESKAVEVDVPEEAQQTPSMPVPF